MTHTFPQPIQKLPQADIPIKGLTAFLSQGDDQQILFMTFEEDTVLPEHQHAGQVGFVLEGRIDLTIDGVNHTFTKGDRYFIPAGVLHSGQIYAGYMDITFFDEVGRYEKKEFYKQD